MAKQPKRSGNKLEGDARLDPSVPQHQKFTEALANVGAHDKSQPEIDLENVSALLEQKLVELDNEDHEVRGRYEVLLQTCRDLTDSINKLRQKIQKGKTMPDQKINSLFQKFEEFMSEASEMGEQINAVAQERQEVGGGESVEPVVMPHMEAEVVPEVGSDMRANKITREMREKAVQFEDEFMAKNWAHCVALPNSESLEQFLLEQVNDEQFIADFRAQTGMQSLDVNIIKDNFVRNVFKEIDRMISAFHGDIYEFVATYFNEIKQDSDREKNLKIFFKSAAGKKILRPFRPLPTEDVVRLVLATYNNYAQQQAGQPGGEGDRIFFEDEQDLQAMHNNESPIMPDVAETEDGKKIVSLVEDEKRSIFAGIKNTAVVEPEEIMSVLELLYLASIPDQDELEIETVFHKAGVVDNHKNRKLFLESLRDALWVMIKNSAAETAPDVGAPPVEPLSMQEKYRKADNAEDKNKDSDYEPIEKKFFSEGEKMGKEEDEADLPGDDEVVDRIEDEKVETEPVVKTLVQELEEARQEMVKAMVAKEKAKGLLSRGFNKIFGAKDKEAKLEEAFNSAWERYKSAQDKLVEESERNFNAVVKVLEEEKGRLNTALGEAYKGKESGISWAWRKLGELNIYNLMEKNLESVKKAKEKAEGEQSDLEVGGKLERMKEWWSSSSLAKALAKDWEKGRTGKVGRIGGKMLSMRFAISMGLGAGAVFDVWAALGTKIVWGATAGTFGGRAGIDGLANSFSERLGGRKKVYASKAEMKAELQSAIHKVDSLETEAVDGEQSEPPIPSRWSRFKTSISSKVDKGVAWTDQTLRRKINLEGKNAVDQLAIIGKEIENYQAWSAVNGVDLNTNEEYQHLLRLQEEIAVKYLEELAGGEAEQPKEVGENELVLLNKLLDGRKDELDRLAGKISAEKRKRWAARIGSVAIGGAVATLAYFRFASNLVKEQSHALEVARRAEVLKHAGDPVVQAPVKIPDAPVKVVVPDVVVPKPAVMTPDLKAVALVHKGEGPAAIIERQLEEYVKANSNTTALQKMGFVGDVNKPADVEHWASVKSYEIAQKSGLYDPKTGVTTGAVFNAKKPSFLNLSFDEKTGFKAEYEGGRTVTKIIEKPVVVEEIPPTEKVGIDVGRYSDSQTGTVSLEADTARGERVTVNFGKGEEGDLSLRGYAFDSVPGSAGTRPLDQVIGDDFRKPPEVLTDGSREALQGLQMETRTLDDLDTAYQVLAQKGLGQSAEALELKRNVHSLMRGMSDKYHTKLGELFTQNMLEKYDPNFVSPTAVPVEKISTVSTTDGKGSGGANLGRVSRPVAHAVDSKVASGGGGVEKITTAPVVKLQPEGTLPGDDMVGGMDREPVGKQSLTGGASFKDLLHGAKEKIAQGVAVVEEKYADMQDALRSKQTILDDTVATYIGDENIEGSGGGKEMLSAMMAKLHSRQEIAGLLLTMDTADLSAPKLLEHFKGVLGDEVQVLYKDATASLGGTAGKEYMAVVSDKPSHAVALVDDQGNRFVYQNSNELYFKDADGRLTVKSVADGKVRLGNVAFEKDGGHNPIVRASTKEIPATAGADKVVPVAVGEQAKPQEVVQAPVVPAVEAVPIFDLDDYKQEVSRLQSVFTDRLNSIQFKGVGGDAEALSIKEDMQKALSKYFADLSKAPTDRIESDIQALQQKGVAKEDILATINQKVTESMIPALKMVIYPLETGGVVAGNEFPEIGGPMDIIKMNIEGVDYVLKAPKGGGFMVENYKPIYIDPQGQKGLLDYKMDSKGNLAFSVTTIKG